MRFLCVTMMNPAEAKPPTPEQMQKMDALIQEMHKKGVLVDTGGRGPDMDEFAIVRKNGSTTVTDGPFAESKEVVGGYALIEAQDRDDLVAWTNRFFDVVEGNVTCYVHEVHSGIDD